MFFLQSLGIGGLREVSPMASVSDVNDRLRDAMRQETELVCAEILKEDRSLLDLLRADFTTSTRAWPSFYGLDSKACG